VEFELDIPLLRPGGQHSEPSSIALQQHCLERLLYNAEVVQIGNPVAGSARLPSAVYELLASDGILKLPM
jgi:hypothetical protein